MCAVFYFILFYCIFGVVHCYRALSWLDTDAGADVVGWPNWLAEVAGSGRGIRLWLICSRCGLMPGSGEILVGRGRGGWPGAWADWLMRWLADALAVWLDSGLGCW